MKTQSNFQSLVLAFYLSAVGLVGAATCNKDNCYRALFPTNNPAVYSSNSAFCATYTTTINTRTTEFPSKVTAGCGTDRGRYSSACSCNPGLPTATTTSTASCAPTPAINLVKNGGFECGLSPWLQVNAYHTEDRLYQSGDNSPNGYVFFEMGPPDLNVPPSSLSQDVAVTAGRFYVLTYRTRSDGCDVDGSLRVLLNGQVVDTQDVCTLRSNTYLDRQVGFTATGGSVNVKFEFRTSGYSTDVFIDNVVVGLANP
ncbi:MAG: hypothetical protein Q9170_003465 [Blastenia crenularia]